MIIQRYLGNKSPLCSNILDVISRVASPGDVVFDAFSGSLAVSRALKSTGYRVVANDINHFSWLCGRAYLASTELPWPEGPWARKCGKAELWAQTVSQLTSQYGEDMPMSARRTDIFDHYCERGQRSEFVSLRGSTGRRRFFSPENAQLIDRALSRIRHWHRAGLTDEQTRCILTATLLSGVERVSNTQGTYHDFPREFTDPRALNQLTLTPPAPADFCGPSAVVVGKAEDSITFAKEVPRHKVLYLDPPYNFRQYTAYYFMLNLLSEYAEIDDIDGYFGDIQHVRGQNMSGDFKSSFCSRASFIPSLQQLIENADCEYVVLSYFDGRNHWGSFKSENDRKGRQVIEDFFDSDLFVSGSSSCVPVARMNYQSYGGHKSREIQEFLFLAQKSKIPAGIDRGGVQEWTGLEVA